MCLRSASAGFLSAPGLDLLAVRKRAPYLPATADVRTPGTPSLSKTLDEQWLTIIGISESLRGRFPGWNYERERGRFFWRRSNYALPEVP